MMNRMYDLGIKRTFRFTAFVIFILFGTYHKYIEREGLT